MSESVTTKAGAGAASAGTAVSGAAGIRQAGSVESGVSEEALSRQGWYVALTKPRAELIAQENLLRQNYHVQLPMVRKIIRRKPTLEPLFPRYIFLQPANPNQSLYPVRSTTGVSNVVRFGMELAVLSNDICAQIMAFAAAQQEGGVNAMLEIQGIRPGQKVIVKDGPFVGLEGLVSALAKDRVLVLMSLLGKDQTIQFNPADLSLA